MSQHNTVPKGYLFLWGDADNIPKGWSVEEWPECVGCEEMKPMSFGDPPATPLVDKDGNSLYILIRQD